MSKNTPSSPSSGANPTAPIDGTTSTCPLQKSISGRFVETEVKCGDPGHVEASGVNIAEGASTSFDIVRIRDHAALKWITAPMNGQRVSNLNWSPKRPHDWRSGDEFQFTVSADGQSATSSNRFHFQLISNYAAETKVFNCSSGRFGWTGKFDIRFADDQITVTIKIKLVNRLGAKPASSSDPLPAIGPAVSATDKANMKSDIEGKLSRKVSLYRSACGFGNACSCAKPIIVVVDFVESGQHHDVNLFQGSGQANARNWTRVKTRDNSWAHETGHLLGWYDEYAGGATGSPPRWQTGSTSHVMNVGLTVPPEYAWDFRDWFAAKTGETWTAK